MTQYFIARCSISIIPGILRHLLAFTFLPPSLPVPDAFCVSSVNDSVTGKKKMIPVLESLIH
jgi:hypothetical protein